MSKVSAFVAMAFLFALAACGDALPPTMSQVDGFVATDTYVPTDTTTLTDTFVPTDTTVVPVGYCTPNPCQHGGTCFDNVGGFVCTCPNGFVGQRCEINVNDCNPNPCQHGGTCTDGVDSYTCTCPAGYAGVDCDIDIDDCAGNSSCQHGGTCVDVGNGYTCNCPTGFTGDYCEVVVAAQCRKLVVKTGWQFQGVVGPDANGDHFPDGDWISCPDGEDACQTLTWCQGEYALFNVQQNDNLPGFDWIVANAQGNNPCTSNADAVVQVPLADVFVGLNPSMNMPCGVICDPNGYTNFLCSY